MDSYDSSVDSAMIVLMVVIGALVYLAILGGIYALFAWILSRVFARAGVPKWKAWVPVYNNWTFLELGRQPGWLSVLAFLPIANIVSAVFMCIAAYKVGIGFGKSGAWVVLYIFLPVIWLIIVAFESTPWEPWRIPTAEAPYGYMPPEGYTTQNGQYGYGQQPGSYPPPSEVGS